MYITAHIKYGDMVEMKQLASSSHIFKTELKACSYKHNPGIYIHNSAQGLTVGMKE